MPRAERTIGVDMSGEPLDSILAEIPMPVMDEYPAVTALRQRAFTKPIVAVTAHSAIVDREKCLDAGCSNYASRPSARRSLIELCRSWPWTIDAQAARTTSRLLGDSLAKAVLFALRWCV